MSTRSVSEFEKIIGYTFNHKKFLKIALTHKSYIDENPTFESNQRYEFLGDTILDFDLTNYLFNKYPDLEEGSLTKIRSSAVNQEALVDIGNKISIQISAVSEKYFEASKQLILPNIKCILIWNFLSLANLLNSFIINSKSLLYFNLNFTSLAIMSFEEIQSRNFLVTNKSSNSTLFDNF